MFFGVLLLCFAGLLYLRWIYIRDYWRRRNVPFDPPHPLVGSLTFLQRVNPGIWMRDLNRFSSPYVGAWWFWRPVLIINSPEIARSVLVKDFGNFKNRLMKPAASDPLAALNVFTVDEPIWSEVRRPLSKAFTSAKMKQFHAFISNKSQQLVERIKRDIDTEINMRELFIDYSTDLISTFAFGISSDATLTGEGPLRTVAKAFMTYNLYRGISMCSIFFWPQLAGIFRFTFYPKPATDYFKKVIDSISKYYEKQNGGQSVMDILIRMREENKDSDLYTNDMVVAQAAVLMLGGFDTTATMLSFLVYELAHSTDIQEKLFRELEDAKRTTDNPFDYKQLSEMTYLNCVIKECLRKYPSMGWLDRKALADYNIDQNLLVKAGTPVYINAIGMHYNPKYYPDPHNFDPDRFLPENEKNIHPYTYMPFGDGPRNCIGQNFSMVSLRITVATLVSNFIFSPLPNKPAPSAVKIEKRSMFYGPGEKLSVKFTPRT